MVRFKPERVEAVHRAGLTFQFHDGSIQAAAAIELHLQLLPGFNSTMVRFKREYRDSKQRSMSLFQFHDGSIQARLNVRQGESSQVFQFHDGSIQAGYASSTQMMMASFNSTMVRFKLFLEDEE